MTARKKRYDYEGIIRSCPEADIRRILRKLARAAAMIALAHPGARVFNEKKVADAIAKRLVP